MTSFNRLLVTVFCIFYWQVACSQEALSHAKLLLTTGEKYYPYVDELALDGGWSIAVVKAAFSQQGETPVIEVLPWKRGYLWASEGKYVGTFPYVRSNERELEFLYSKPINFVPVRFYVTKQSEVTVPAQLREKRLCLPHGYVLSDELEAAIKDLEMIVQNASQPGACVRQVIKGWSDAGLINGYSSEQQNRERFNTLQHVRILDEVVANVSLHFIVSRSLSNGKSIIESFDQALDDLIKSGERQKIDSRYLEWLNQIPAPSAD